MKHNIGVSMRHQVYEPAEDSYLLAEQVGLYAHGTVLDIGTGSGIQAFCAAKMKRVRSVAAADLSDAAVSYVKKRIKEEKARKITVKKSDLFSTIKSRFDTIVFNPPYLPLDEREPMDSRLATTGGKRGYELLQRFLLGMNDHLLKDGAVLILFSSLTNKEKVDSIVADVGYDAECVAKQNVGFETLFVYKITRNWLLEELFPKGITGIQALMKGHRGMIYTGMYRHRKIAIKAQRRDITVRTITREAGMIAKLNRKGIAPKLRFKGTDYFAYDFAPGEFIVDFLEHSRKTETLRVLREVMRQCRVLDTLHITKEEMHNPWKHVIVGKKIVLVDFERAHYDTYPQNVTQFCQYLMRNHAVLSKKGIRIDKEELMAAARDYKKEQTAGNYRRILVFLAE